MSYVNLKNYCFAIVISLLSVAPAWSAEDSTGKEDYEKATMLFKAKEYKAALVYFEQSHAKSGGRASTLLGIAQCERALGSYAKAIEHFEKFLVAYPEHPQVDRIRSTLEVTRLLEKSTSKHSVDELKVAASTQKKTEAEADDNRLVAAPGPTTKTNIQTADTDESILESPWFWVVTGLLVAGGAVSAGFAVAANDSMGEVLVAPAYGGTTGKFITPLAHW